LGGQVTTTAQRQISQAPRTARQALLEARASLVFCEGSPWPAQTSGRIAGGLFLAAVIAALPNYFLEEPRPGPAYWALAVIALATAVVCFRVDWERLPRSVFHVIAGVAAVETAASTLVADARLEIFYVFLIVYVAFAFESRREIATWVLITGALMFVPLPNEAGHHDGVDILIRQASLTFGVCCVVAFVVTFLREHLQAERRRLHEFAGETIDIAVGWTREHEGTRRFS
jgi:hypothetical protein